MPDQDIAEEESSEDSEAQEAGSEDEVDIQGTKFNLSRVAEDAQVDEDDSADEEEEDDDEGSKADQEESGTDDNDDDETSPEGKSGWADAMAKVLNMGKDSESAPGLLSKAKLDSSAPAEGEASHQPRDAVRRAIKKETEDTGRVRPDVVKDRAREKALVKLATRGVVQLFNAVRDQQKDLKSQLNAVGQSTRKREQVYKSIDKEGFLDVLSGNKRNSGKTEQQPPTRKKARPAGGKEDEEASSWSVIKDDYMLGAKMKDWDKESDTEEVA